jgi:4-alpha-glucanotransferase
VPADSAEVWAYPELFQLHEDGTCKAVAGCPPDGFSATGQLWGNPLYDWKHHRDTGYAWWISRMRRCSSLFDIVRIDHFRGFDQYYAIPADSADARIGQWEEGPGIGLFRAIEKEIPGLTIIAEDLGYITESVRQLVRDTGYPNMKVLEFAFDSRDSSGRESYLPYNFDKNCVVYTGTHDNETLVGWLDHILPEEREEVRAFTGLDGAGGDPWAYDACEDAAGETGFCDAAARGTDLCAADACRDTACEDAVNDAGRDLETRRLARAMVRAAMASVGNLCVIPMQDWLLLGDEARINTPSTTGKNWVWRMDRGAASPELAAQIRRMTRTYGR